MAKIESLQMPPPSIRAIPIVDRLGGRRQVRCYQSATMPAAHDLIRANLHRAPMYNGTIEGSGPRYCPSIEDKIGRFADKDSHPVFLEPEGWRSHEIYVQGLSTSLPPDIQQGVVNAIPGMQQARITRFGYAVEYDALDPTNSRARWRARRIAGPLLRRPGERHIRLRRGCRPGARCRRKCCRPRVGPDPLILTRQSSYIGVMIDDLISKPFTEPYRMLTSRAEYRLLLRAILPILAWPARPRVSAWSPSPIGRCRAETAIIEATIDSLGTIWLGDNARHADALEHEGLVRRRDRSRPSTWRDVPMPRCLR